MFIDEKFPLLDMGNERYEQAKMIYLMKLFAKSSFYFLKGIEQLRHSQYKSTKQNEKDLQSLLVLIYAPILKKTLLELFGSEYPAYFLIIC